MLVIKCVFVIAVGQVWWRNYSCRHLALVKQTTAYQSTTTALFLSTFDESSSNLKTELSNTVYYDVVELNIYRTNRHASMKA